MLLGVQLKNISMHQRSSSSSSLMKNVSCGCRCRKHTVTLFFRGAEGKENTLRVTSASGFFKHPPPQLYLCFGVDGIKGTSNNMVIPSTTWLML